MTPPLLALALAIAGALLAILLPPPLKLLISGPMLALGLGLLLFQLSRTESPHQRALRRLEEENLDLRTRADREDQLRRGILASLREGVLVFGEDRRLLQANPGAALLLGSGSRLVEGAGLAEAFRDPESLTQLEMAFHGEAAQWTLKREPRVLRVRALPFQAGLEARGVLITLDDITRMEALETTRQKFISNASHELKTPVTAIRVAAENLQDGGAVGAEGESSLRSIIRSVERMTLLLNDISELSRIETGALMLEPRPLPVAAFARELVEDLAAQAQAKGVRLVLDLAPEMEALRIEADPLRLHQLLENLLSNAVKFSPRGSEVRLAAGKEEARLRWTVSDQGPGIAETEQSRVFERFYRTSSARAVPGTGLGLAIVKHLARLMGGEITLESEAGKGAAFTFRMPL
ncbi:MAG TPA: PAS domain-containing sensor histidine kinase [Holophagaceae bacterium]|nr:PAS domain-containing sensor histidine kinase [Holophagaceae bacterium]